MQEASGREPERDEGDDQLHEADECARLEDIQVGQDVRDGHQPQGSQESQAWG